MGQRANLIIVRDGEYRLFYNHWCANSLDQEIFWGPQYLQRFIEAQEEVDREEGWLDDVWCEGCALMDMDKRKLLFFGGDDILFDVPLREMYLLLVNKQWQGWKIQWLNNGIVGMANYVGVDEKKVISPKCSHGDIDTNIERIAKAQLPKKGEVVGIVSLQREEGNAKFLLFDWMLSAAELLEYGEEAVEALQRKEGISYFDVSRWCQEFPMWGLHVELDKRRIYFWQSDVLSDEKSLYALCPNWQLINWHSDFRKHKDLLKGKCFWEIEERKVLVKKIKDIVTRKENDPGSTMNDLIGALTQNGQEIKINPKVFSYKNVDQGNFNKEMAFDELVKSIFTHET